MLVRVKGLFALVKACNTKNGLFTTPEIGSQVFIVYSHLLLVEIAP